MQVHRQLRIPAPPAVVWRCLTETELLKQWIVELVDDTPIGPARHAVGAETTMRLRERGKIVSLHTVVTAWQPQRELAIRMSGGHFAAGMAVDVGYGLAPGPGDSTILDYDVRMPLKGVMFTLLSPLIRLAARSNADKSLRRLSALAVSIAAG